MKRRDLLKITSITGYTIFMGGLGSTLYSCRQEETQSFGLALLSDEQAALINALADQIIPATETMGAIEAGVPGFTDLILSDVYTNEEKERFLSGLDGFQTSCVQKTGKSFTDLKPAERFEYLMEVKETSFFNEIKKLTLDCYYHTERGIKENYNYLPVPGKYMGCMQQNAESMKIYRGGDL